MDKNGSVSAAATGVVDTSDYPGLTTIYVKAGNLGDSRLGQEIDVVLLIATTCESGSGCLIDGVPVRTSATRRECNALLAIFNTTSGGSWTNNTGWATPTDPCTWFGISCDIDGVSELNLKANGLSGPVPPEFGELTNLRVLIVDQNLLTGPLPSELGNLTNLEVIDFYLNPISGQIPPELGNLVNVTRFVFAFTGGGLTGTIPPELGNLTNVTFFSFDGNNLTGPIPPELGGLTNVSYLGLGRNSLSGEIPPELGELSNLTRLVLSSNELTGNIPPELGNLSNLTALRLAENQLTGGVPAEIGNLSQLRWLNLSDNQLSGDLSAAMMGIMTNRPANGPDGNVGLVPNGCFTAEDPAVADWLDVVEPGWDGACA